MHCFKPCLVFYLQRRLTILKKRWALFRVPQWADALWDTPTQNYQRLKRQIYSTPLLQQQTRNRRKHMRSGRTYSIPFISEMTKLWELPLPRLSILFPELPNIWEYCKILKKNQLVPIPMVTSGACQPKKLTISISGKKILSHLLSNDYSVLYTF